MRKSAQSSKKDALKIVKQVQNFAHTHKLWGHGDKLLVGISGGPDSVCLLHLLSTIAKASNLSLFAVHINYRLRGKESEGDEAFVRSFCKDLAIPLFVFTPKIPRKKSENVFRTIRYRRFEALRARLGCASIAVGHNTNDQAETLLLHLFRGCGTAGMKGMSPKHGHIIRPILPLTRGEILDYLRAHTLSFREDSSNNSTDYTRNIIRNKILPQIAKTVQPNIIARLAQSAELFAGDAELLESMPLPSHHCEGNKCTFQNKIFLPLPPAHQRRFLLFLCAKLRKSSKDIAGGNIEEIRKALLSTKNKHQQITFLGLIYERKGDTVTLRVS